MNKGFTLVEVMGAIIILGLTALITIPAISTITKNAKNEAYEKQVDTIIDSTKDWVIKYTQNLPEDDTPTYVNIQILKEEGFLVNEEIINPKTRSEMTGCVEIKYQESFKQYAYKYLEECPGA